MRGTAEYEHKQVGWVHWVLIVFAVAVGVIQVWNHPDWPIDVVLAIAGVAFLLLAASFATLTIRSEGDELLARYGPLPLFAKRIPIDSITRVEVGRSSWIDGWGIHWVPGRGWTYNLSGFSCVILHIDGKILRLGTDDAAGLAAFLRERAAV